MDSNQIAIERTFDDQMNEKMKASYNAGKEAPNSNYMKQAKKDLSEARSLIKKGLKNEAKEKYKSSLDNMQAAIQLLSDAIKDLDHSGNGKGNFRLKAFSIVASTAAWIIAMPVLAVNASTAFTDGNNGAGVASILGLGLGTAAHQGILKFINKFVGKDDKLNYEKFAKQYKDDPRKTLLMMVKDIGNLYNSIDKEMKKLCK